jgi:hypothetical protein
VEDTTLGHLPDAQLNPFLTFFVAAKVSNMPSEAYGLCHPHKPYASDSMFEAIAIQNTTHTLPVDQAYV